MVADPAGRIRRLQGGFWTTPSTPVGKHVEQSRYYAPHDVPEWHTGALTIRAMEARGWLQRANVHPEEWRDERELTEAGRAVAPKEVQ
jgi:hypothetical protein